MSMKRISDEQVEQVKKLRDGLQDCWDTEFRKMLDRGPLHARQHLAELSGYATSMQQLDMLLSLTARMKEDEQAREQARAAEGGAN
jgi:hypothetical protein